MLRAGIIPSCVHFARKLGANWEQKGCPGDEVRGQEWGDLAKVEE